MESAKRKTPASAFSGSKKHGKSHKQNRKMYRISCPCTDEWETQTQQLILPNLNPDGTLIDLHQPFISVEAFFKDNTHRVIKSPLFVPNFLMFEDADGHTCKVLSNELRWRNNKTQITTIPFLRYLNKIGRNGIHESPISIQDLIIQGQDSNPHGLHHLLFDRFRLLWAFGKFLLELETYHHQVPWLTYASAEMKWSEFMELFNRSLYVLFYNPEAKHIKQKPKDQNSLGKFKNSYITPECFTIETFNSFAYVDPLKFLNHTLSTSDKKKESEFVVDCLLANTGNAKHLFSVPRFAMLPIFPEDNLTPSQILPTVDRRSLLTRLFKEFGRNLFDLKGVSVSTYQSFETSQYPFLMFEDVFRYIIEPEISFHGKCQSIEEVLFPIENSLKWIVDHPWMPEISWISSFRAPSVLHEMESNLAYMALDCKNDKDGILSRFFELCNFFGTNNEKTEDFIHCLPSKMFLHYTNPGTLRVLVQRPKRFCCYVSNVLLRDRSNHSDMLCNSIAEAQTRNPFKLYPLLTNTEEAIESYFSKIHQFSLRRIEFSDYYLKKLDFLHQFCGYVPILPVKVFRDWILLPKNDFASKYENSEYLIDSFHMSIVKNILWTCSLGQSMLTIHGISYKIDKLSKSTDVHFLQELSKSVSNFPSYEFAVERRQKQLKEFSFILKYSSNLPFPKGTILNETFYGLIDSASKIKFVLSPFEISGEILSNETLMPSIKIPVRSKPYNIAKKTDELWKLYSYYDERMNETQFWDQLYAQVYEKSFSLDNFVKDGISLPDSKKSQEWLTQECMFWLLYLYNRCVFLPERWMQLVTRPLMSNAHTQLIDLTSHEILPIQWKGGDLFVLLIGFMSNLKKRYQMDQVLSSQFFSNWKNSRDFTKSVMQTSDDWWFLHYHDVELEHFEKHLKKPKEQSRIVLNSQWMDVENAENMQNVMSVFSHHFMDVDPSTHFLRNMFQYPFMFKSPDANNPVLTDLAHGQGVDQHALTLFATILQNISSLDWFGLRKSISPTPNVAWQLTPKNYCMIGKVLNYIFLHHKEVHIHQPPLFWKLIGFEKQPIDLQDIHFLEPELCVNWFKQFYSDQNELDIVFSEDATVPVVGALEVKLTPETYGLWVSHELQEQFISKIPEDVINWIKTGFRTTKLDYTPTYRHLYATFWNSDLFKVGVEDLIASLTFDDSVTNHSTATCISDVHFDKVNMSLCPMTCLIRWIRESTEDERRQLLMYISSKPFMDLTYQDHPILVSIHELDKDHLPTARTCFQQLELYKNTSKVWKDFDECYQDFRKQLKVVLENVNGFGFV